MVPYTAWSSVLGRQSGGSGVGTARAARTSGLSARGLRPDGRASAVSGRATEVATVPTTTQVMNPFLMSCEAPRRGGRRWRCRWLHRSGGRFERSGRGPMQGGFHGGDGLRGHKGHEQSRAEFGGNKRKYEVLAHATARNVVASTA